MAITYPLTFPTVVSPVSFSITTAAVVATSRSPYTLSAQYHEKDGQSWILEMNFGRLTAVQIREFQAFITALNGRRGTFMFGDYLQGTPRGTVLGVPVVNTSGQKGETLSTKGWTPNSTNVLRKGDWIQLGNRLHMVLNDHSSDASGFATLDIWPRIRKESVTDGQTIITQNAKGIWKLQENENGWENALDKTYTFSLRAIEAL